MMCALFWAVTQSIIYDEFTYHSFFLILVLFIYIFLCIWFVVCRADLTLKNNYNKFKNDNI